MKKGRKSCTLCDILEGKKNEAYMYWISGRNFLIVFDRSEKTFGHLLALSKNPRVSIIDILEGYDRDAYEEFVELIHRAAKKYVEFANKHVHIMHMHRNARCPNGNGTHFYMRFIPYVPNKSEFS